MPVDLRTADVIIGAAGPAGGGVTNSQLALAIVGLAPANASFVTLKAEAGLSAESNLGALTDGILYNDVTAGVAALRPAVGADLPAHTHLSRVALAFVIDGGGSVITTGNKGYSPPMPFAGTIKSWTILGEQVNGVIQIDVWKRPYASYPPGDAQSITAANEPKIASTGNKATDSVLTGWTTAVSVGDIFGFNVDSVTAMVKVQISLEIERTV